MGSGAIWVIWAVAPAAPTPAPEMGWFTEFMLEYWLWTFLDWVRDTELGHAFAASAVGMAMTAISRIWAHKRLRRDLWVGFLACCAVMVGTVILNVMTARFYGIKGLPSPVEIVGQDAMRGSDTAAVKDITPVSEPPWLKSALVGFSVFVASLAVIAVVVRRRPKSIPATIYQGPMLKIDVVVERKPISPLPPDATAEDWISLDAGEKLKAARHPAFLMLLRVKNDSPHQGAIGDARNLRAYIIVYDESWNNRLFAPIEGSWMEAHPSQPGFAGNLKSEPIILRTGDTRDLALAIKFPETEFSYALEAPSCIYPNWENPRFKIHCGCCVRVEFRSDELSSDVRCYALTYGGAMQGLTPGPRPCPEGII